MMDLVPSAQGRPLSGAERLWLAGRRICPPFAITTVAEWDGPLEPDRWREAVARAAATYPAARVRLRGWLGGARWVVHPDAPPLELVAHDAWDGHAPWPRLDAPLDPASAPCEVLLQPGTTTSRVLVRGLHASMDGRGVLGFLQAILDAAHDRPLARCEAGPLTDADLARHILRGQGTPLKLPKPRAQTPTPREAPFAWRRYRCAPSPAKPLHALALALWEDYAPHPIRLAIPADLRPAMPGLSSGANLTGVHHLDLDGAPDPARLRGLLDEVRERKQAAAWALAQDPVRHLPLALLSWLGSFAHASQRRAGLVPTTATLSHLGRADQRIDERPARLWILPMDSPGQAMFMTLCHNPDALDLVIRGPQDPARWDRLAARLGAPPPSSLTAATTPSLGRP